MDASGRIGSSSRLFARISGLRTHAVRLHRVEISANCADGACKTPATRQEGKRGEPPKVVLAVDADARSLVQTSTMAGVPVEARELIESGPLGHLVGLDGDELVSAHLAPDQRKLRNVRRDPRVSL